MHWLAWCLVPEAVMWKCSLTVVKKCIPLQETHRDERRLERDMCGRRLAKCSKAKREKGR